MTRPSCEVIYQLAVFNHFFIFEGTKSSLGMCLPRRITAAEDERDDKH